MAVHVTIGCRTEPREAKRLARVLSQTDRINNRIGLFVRNQAVSRLRERAGIMTPAGYPSHSKGALARQTQVHQTPGVTVVETTGVHAAIQQYGKIDHKSKTGKKLAIPVTDKARKMGSPRDWPEGELQLVVSGNKARLVKVSTRFKSAERKMEQAEYRLGILREQHRQKIASGKKRFQTGTAQNIRDLQERSLKIKRSAARIVHQERVEAETQYILVHSVTIPAQPYLKWGPEEEQFARDEYARALRQQA